MNYQNDELSRQGQHPSEVTRTCRDIAKLILPPDHPRLNDFYFPYSYEIRGRHAGFLSYFGTRHFSDPNDPMFGLIVDSFERFKPDYILVELEPKLNSTVSEDVRLAFRDTYRSISREQAIRKSEVYLGVKLAADHMIPVECPEPSLAQAFMHLHESGFAPIAVASFYLLRAASNYPLYEREMSLDELIQYRIGQLAPQWAHDPSLLSWSKAQAFAREVFGDTFSFRPEVIKPKVSPILSADSPERSIISDVSRSLSTLTDVTIISRIIELVTEGRRLYALFGASHAIQEEAALRELIQGN